ncbi:GroES-like protein [Aspergillus sclerotiicarbonarius CBS 121057]|uniref:GroES-like protein n=1 Tax=Aspergillus sclerotiicarbonarius (strain CBS 121057 / IBT 28362) TaxID=1448318 RepID=A0A319ES48_ASPSB|nr:GroES-like protein [Aspergillus sclerotiicarbonarius CBS 121057]
MKEIINLPGPRTKLIDSPIPSINADQVLIKVVVSGSNPKDWKVAELAGDLDNAFFQRYAHVRQGVNQGDDIAGVVVKTGRNVVEFKEGDRVAAFHEMLTPGGSYAEYAVAWAHTTFHLPEGVSFEEAATIPLAALTAVISLYHHHGFPAPWSPPPHTPTLTSTQTLPQPPTPFLIYGASTAVGSFAIKLARASNIHPIISIAGAGSPYVENLLDASKGDRVIDYRKGIESTVQEIKSILSIPSTSGGKEEGGEGIVLKHVLDTIVSETSISTIKQVLASGGGEGERRGRGRGRGGKVNTVLPLPSPNPYPSGIDASTTWVSSAHEVVNGDDCRDLCFVFCRWFTRALALPSQEQGEGDGQGKERKFSGHPYVVREGGLGGVEGAMRDLRDGRASAVKFVFRVGETPGLG